MLCKILLCLLYIATLWGIYFVGRLLFVIGFRPIERDYKLANNSLYYRILLAALIIPFIVYGVLMWLETPAEALWATGSSADSYKPSLGWSVYFHYMNTGNQGSVDSRYIFWSTFLGVVGTIALNGLLVSFLVNIVDRRKEQWLKGEIRYGERQFDGHTIVVGGSEISIGIIKSIIERNNRNKILILTKDKVEKLRSSLKSAVGDDANIVIYHGDRTSTSDIAQLFVHRAGEVFIIGEEVNSKNDDESYHDTLNMKCAEIVGHLAERREAERGKLKCHIMFEYQTTFAAMQIAKIDDAKVKYAPFNYYENWAFNVFAGDRPADGDTTSYIPLDGDGITQESKEFVHLIVVGMSRMGIALANTAAHIAHYPNFCEKDKNPIRTRITFIDINATQESQYYMGRFEELFKLARHRSYKSGKWSDWENDNLSATQNSHFGNNFIDVEWQFMEGAVDSSEIRNYLIEATNEPNAKVTIALCLPEINRAVASAIYMPDVVYDKAQEVLVYQRNGGEIIHKISDSNFHYHNKLRAFGMNDKCYNLSIMDEIRDIDNSLYGGYQIAKKRYEEHKAEYVAPGKSKAAKLWSNYYNIYAARTKFRSCRPGIRVAEGNIAEFTESELEALCRVEHNRWNVEQLLMRYRPLTEKEIDEAKMTDASMSNQRKEELKREGAHLNICPNEMLEKNDAGITIFDLELTKVLPSAYNALYNTK